MKHRLLLAVGVAGLVGAVAWAQQNYPAVLIGTNLSTTVTVAAGTNAAPTLVATNWVGGFRATLALENRSATEVVNVYAGRATNSPVIARIPAGGRLVREFPVIDNGPVSCATTSSATATVHVYQDGTTR